MPPANNTMERGKLGALPFVIGGISFIPLLGIPFAITAIIWRIRTKKAGGKKLAIAGSCGALFTAILYGGLFYFGFIQRGGVYDGLRMKLAQTEINSLVPAIEFYKTQYGEYPASLEALQKTFPKQTFISIYDPSDVHVGHPRLFFYVRIRQDHYYLRGVGPDGVPFTADDIVPQIAVGGKLGLLTEQRAQ